MCGICGFSGENDRHVLKSMLNAVLHRGPDDEGFYSDGLMNLGFRRLSIIDVEKGRQPIHNEEKSVWCVINGEIYNFPELRNDLAEKGHLLYTDHSDSEVIVHLYEEYGSDFVHKLNGMFAIALWDMQRQTLFLIRDRMGVKPLFYSLIGNKLIFGSEIKCLLAHPAYCRDINYDALYHYFSLKNVPAPMTVFKGIYSLLPGELLVFSKGKICDKRKWWKVLFKEDKNLDKMHIKESILRLMEDATRIRMISDVPFGAYLSGGVDSSFVVALMSRFSDKPIKTFCLGYEDELKNKKADLYHARIVSKTFGTEHYEYIMSYREMINDIEKVICSFDQPYSGTISTFFLSKLIKKHVKVALSGDGSDELFGSYLSHRVAQPMHHFKRLHDKLEENSLCNDYEELFRPCDINFLKNLFDKSGGDEIKWRYYLYTFTDKEKDKLLSDKFRAELRKSDTLSLITKYFNYITSDDPLNRILEMEWNTQLPDQVLAFVDFLSMAHSVEVRSPFLDYRLVEFAATIPGNLKIQNGNVKAVLKESVEDLLPRGITKRPKEGFVLPVFDWMQDSMKKYVSSILSKKNLKKHNLFNIDVVSDLLHRYNTDARNNAAKIWNLMMFQIWWMHFSD